MEIIYYVEDGYANSQGRPHHLTIPDEDLAEYETESDKRQFISDCIEEHFRDRIHWACDIDAYLQKIKTG